MEVFVCRQIRNLDAQEVFHRAGNIVAFANLAGGSHGPFKGLLILLQMPREADSNKDGKTAAYSGPIDLGPVAENNPVALQRLHTTQTGGGREADPLGQIRIADATIAFEFLQYITVNAVNFDHKLLSWVCSRDNNKNCAAVVEYCLIMTYEMITALAGFAFVSLITPGPNNLMLMASGMNYGFWRTVPHMLGIALGFPAMLLLVGAGLMKVFAAMPASYLALKIVSAVYLSYLAWKIATAEPAADAVHDETSRPFTFLQAAAFQWVNPKAWAMALTAISAYTPPSHPVSGVIVAALTFALIGSVTISAWASLGQQLRRFLTDPVKRRVFNIICAIVLVASLWPMLSSLG